MNEAPKTIYLQYDQEEATWHRDRTYFEDIEYVQATELIHGRAERYALMEELREAREALAKVNDLSALLAEARDNRDCFYDALNHLFTGVGICWDEGEPPVDDVITELDALKDEQRKSYDRVESSQQENISLLTERNKESRRADTQYERATNSENANAALKAQLDQAREGISDLWRDCDKLPHAAYCDPTGFGYCTCYRSGFNSMLHNLHSAIVGNTPPEQEA